jgi:hypothetical protein
LAVYQHAFSAHRYDVSAADIQPDILQADEPRIFGRDCQRYDICHDEFDRYGILYTAVSKEKKVK